MLARKNSIQIMFNLYESTDKLEKKPCKVQFFNL